MPIPLDDGGGNRAPAIKLRSIGDHFDGAIVDIKQVPRKQYGSNEYKRRPDGTIAQQLVVTSIAIGGTAVVSDNGQDRRVEPGELVAVFIAGRDRWDPQEDKKRGKGDAKSWANAKNDLGDLAVGDVFRYRFDDEIEGQGTNPRKVRTFKLRHPKAEEAEQTRRCEELHRNATAITLEDSNGGAVEDEEEPF